MEQQESGVWEGHVIGLQMCGQLLSKDKMQFCKMGGKVCWEQNTFDNRHRNNKKKHTHTHTPTANSQRNQESLPC